MNTLKKISTILLILSFGLVGSVLYAKDKASMPAKDNALKPSSTLVTKAPAFSLKNDQGKVVSLSQFKGKYVVLEWTNHDCPFVKKHYGSGNMQSLQKKYTDKGVVWLSIVSSAPGKQGSVTAKESQALSAKRNASPTHVLLDATGEIGQLYHAKTTPHMFIIDPKGMVVYQGAIDSIPSASPQDISKAVNYIDKAFEALFAKKPVTTAITKPYGCSVKY